MSWALTCGSPRLQPEVCAQGPLVLGGPPACWESRDREGCRPIGASPALAQQNSL